MKKILLIITLITLIILINTFHLQQYNSIQHQSHQIQNFAFTNQTGTGVTKKMLNDIILFINAASGYYKNDIIKNIQYIKKKLDQTYGSNQQNFFVFIQTQQNVQFHYLIWSNFQRVFAALSNVNIINSSWSYMIYRRAAPPTTHDYALITPGKIGDSVNIQIQKAINGFVNIYEPDEPCTCNRQYVDNIVLSLIQFYNEDWNIICDASGVTTGMVKAEDGLWGSFRPKNCYYSLFVTAK